MFVAIGLQVLGATGAILRSRPLSVYAHPKPEYLTLVIIAGQCGRSMHRGGDSIRNRPVS